MNNKEKLHLVKASSIYSRRAKDKLKYQDDIVRKTMAQDEGPGGVNALAVPTPKKMRWGKIPAKADYSMPIAKNVLEAVTDERKVQGNQVPLYSPSNSKKYPDTVVNDRVYDLNTRQTRKQSGPGDFSRLNTLRLPTKGGL